jgi:glycosyltransferase involved in cell wall biosynthesis
MAPHKDAAAMGELYRLFRELRPEIVHTHNPKPGLYGRIAARAARVPVVLNTVHGLYALPEDRFAKRSVVYSLERLASMCSDAELIQNPEDITTLLKIGVPSKKIRLLGNGVDLTRFKPLTDGDRESIEGTADTQPETRSQSLRDKLRGELGVGASTVLCVVVGRLVWEKGYREVFEAAEAIKRLGIDAVFVVIGPRDPEKSDGVDEKAIAAAEASGVRFLGMRSDVESLYAAMDLYVLASYREGFPRSAMEAAASGLPVIATDIRGCRQVVDQGLTGLLVPARDSQALTYAILEIINDPIKRSEMGTRAVEKARAEFDHQRVIDITLETYERLLSDRRVRR